MAIEQSKRPVSTARLAATTARLLDASTLCAIATTQPDGAPYVNTAYFAWDRDLRIVWLSHPDATHSRNLERRADAAIAVYASTQAWGHPDRGLQLLGSARRLPDPAAAEAEALYRSRFADYRAEVSGAYRFFAFRPARIKLFDEREFGAGRFVTATVGPDGRLAWARTEVYRSDA